MQHYNIVLACDQAYYDNWAIDLLKSINYYNPWIKLHCEVINPTKKNMLSFANVTEHNIDFDNDSSKLSYLQSRRFIAAANIPSNENVVTLDCDTICTRSIDHIEIHSLFQKQYVLKHKKDGRWLAGMVTFNTYNDFRFILKKSLLEKDIKYWKPGRDQDILEDLAKPMQFIELPKNWMSLGKHKNHSVFLTLKGSQKYKEKYLRFFNNFKKYN
jgi:hypothetical protein